MRKTLSVLFVVALALFGVPMSASADVPGPGEGWGRLPIEASSDASVVVANNVVYSFVVDVDGHLVLHQFDPNVGEAIRP
ncbi:MAG: hypothetical protein QOG30_2159, partial [Acidimicrobiaceae bacterium]